MLIKKLLKEHEITHVIHFAAQSHVQDSFTDALRTNREKLMTLSDETIICPGHGPMSTIGEEKKYNPFFPEF